MRKLFIIALLFIIATAFKLNGTRHITGTVTDKDGVLPGVTINIEGTKVTTVTDAKGKYAINIPEGKKTLVFAFTGYQTQKVKLGKSNMVNIMMNPSSTGLNEVVVVGYGTQKKVTVTGAVAQVNVAQERAAAVAVRGARAQQAKAKAMAYAAPPAVYGYFSEGVRPAPRDEDNESYKGIAENSFLEATANPLSTFSIDVDAASYSNVRRFINGGSLPPADAVRIEEMINYFNYNLPAPKNNDPVAITTELSAAPWNTKHRLLRIGLKAKTIPAGNLPVSNLVFLIDVSGSMSSANKLPLVKSSMKMLVNQLRAQDKVSIVVYAGAAGIVLPPTTGDKKATINNAIDNLEAGGSTAGGEGIKLAYTTARVNFLKSGNNRVILATDGDFNVGASSDEDMEKLITKERESGVFLSVLGYGMGNYKDSKMETLADKGNGNYAYIDNITEARKTLVSEFGGTLFTVAKDVKLQIEFNPAMVQAYRLIGYENRLLNKEDFNNDKKDAGDMGSGHTVTALYEIVPAGVKDYVGSVDPLKYQKVEAAANAFVSGSKELVTIKFRYKDPTSSVSKLSQVAINDVPKDFTTVSTDFKFAAAVAEVGMLLRDSQFKQNATWAQAINNARAGKGDDHEGYRAEFVKLAESARLLVKNEEPGR